MTAEHVMQANQAALRYEIKRLNRYIDAALRIAHKHESESQAWRDVVTLLEEHDTTGQGPVS